MKISFVFKKLMFLTAILVIIAGLSVGCETETLSKHKVYESRCLIYVQTAQAGDQLSISSSDLSMSQAFPATYEAILRSSRIRTAVDEKYPDMEYELTLEPVDDTNIYEVVATSKNPQYLKEICDMAADVLCRTVYDVIEGSSCKIAGQASQPTIVEDSN